MSVELVVLVYRLTEPFPRIEQFGLVSQMRRAAVSIPANIAEGNSRLSLPSYLHHVNIALGSHGELRALVEIASRLGYLTTMDAANISPLIDHTGRLLSGLRRALKDRSARFTPRSPISDPRSLIPDR